VGVGAKGWKGVGVAVAPAGTVSRLGLIPTAAGTAAAASGKYECNDYQAKNQVQSHSRCPSKSSNELLIQA
jgi:hypothetical protein